MARQTIKDLQVEITNLQQECNELQNMLVLMGKEKAELEFEVKLQEGLVEFWTAQARKKG